MRIEILTLLRNTTEYLSGQELCNRFGVSRTAVWKVINQLKEEGYEIEAVPNKGYRLKSYPDILSKGELMSRMQTNWAARSIVYLDETGSTNNDAKRLADEGEVHGTLVVSDTQSSGRGRRGKAWSSPPGTTISMTLLLRPSFMPDKASMLTLLMAMAVTTAIEEECALQTKIKWPNDIIINRKKVAGILTEMNAETDYIHYVVIGVGINVNLEAVPEEIAEIATSLRLEKKRKVSRAEIIERTMYHFEQYYEEYLKYLDLSFVMDEYNQRLISLDSEVKVLDPKGEFRGISRGINKDGELMVETEDGGLHAIYAGEVSVRGLYGYV